MAAIAPQIYAEWRSKVAIVTGASSGIGYDLLASLANSGIVTVGCARNIAKIELLAESYAPSKESPMGLIIAVKCDVAQEESVLQLFETVKTQLGGVDILINNAGIASNAPLINGKTSDWAEMLNTNVLGLSMCTREFIKQLKDRNANDGYIININSMSGHRVLPISGIHFYSATKFAVNALTEGLRQEMRAEGNNVKVSQISPGLVATEFMGRFRKDMEIADKFYSENPHMESGDISNAVLYLLSTPPGVCVHDILVRPTNGLN